jgi:serine/threonine protein kinase
MYLARECFLDHDKKKLEHSETTGSENLTAGQAKSPVGLKEHEQAESSQPLQQLEPGSIIAERYKVLFLIGRGAMGSVYKVEHLALRKNLALKTLNTIAASDVNIRRFQNEALAASKLEHPNLVRAVDSGWIGTQPFLVMDLVQGQTLSEYLKHVARLPLAFALRLFIPICFGLAYAHQQGVVHRDLKPSNIMLVSEGKDGGQFVAKIVDFGIAKLDYGQAGTLTQTGEVFGTPLYMSPEQCLGAKVDNRSDIYALGCVLYEALTGAPPFRGASALETMMQHRNENPLSLKEASLGTEFPPSIEQIVFKMLEKEPQDRYQGFLDVAQDLASVQRGENVKVQTTTESKTRGPGKPLPTRLIITSTVLVSLMLALIVFTIRTHKTDTSDSALEPLAKITTGGPTTIATAGKSESTANAQPAELDNPLQPFSRIVGEYRVFDFGALKLGKLQIGNRQFPATKTVKVPKKQPIILNAHFMQICKYPQLLSRFRENDLSDLCFKKTEDLDGEMVGLPQRTFDNALCCAWHLKSLRRLCLPGLPITIRCLNNLHIDDLKKLTMLDISSTHIDGKDLARLQPFLSQLTILTISELTNGGAVVRALQGSKKLSGLDVSGTDMTDSDVTVLAAIPTLQKLDLSRCKLTDVGLVRLTKLKLLERINLSWCPVTMVGVKALANSHPHLEALVLPDSLATQAEKITALFPECTISYEGPNTQHNANGNDDDDLP